MPQPHLRFSSPSARVQYWLLTGLFHLAVTRGLYGRFARALGRLFPKSNAVQLHSPNAAPFWILLNDGYWTRFVLYHHNYEPEVGRVLTAAAGHTALFCDLGANTGYWTTRTAPHFAQIIAVEASRATFKQLSANAGHLANVTLHNAAIFAQSGIEMSFVNVHNSHASARLEQSDAAGPQDTTETVTTLAIDDLIPAGTAALIKLDVEGAEIPALKGATRALNDGAVVIYEDHGGDLNCPPTAYLLNQPGMQVYAIETNIHPVTSLDAARQIKTDRFKGYNFLAAHQASPLLAHILKKQRKSIP